MYAAGTIKLTWVNKQQPNVLESKMFPPTALQQAQKEGIEKGRFMIMKLIKTQNDNYSWEVLPDGEGKKFIHTMKYHYSILFNVSIVAFVTLAGYGLYKLLKR